MFSIIIRRIIGGVVFAVGLRIMWDEIGWYGSTGVMLAVIGLVIVAGSRALFLTVSKEYKEKQEKDTVTS